MKKDIYYPFLIILLMLPAEIMLAQNVGIGTATPRAKLSVVGSGAHILSVEGTNPFISFYSNNDYKGYLWYHNDKVELGSSKNEPVVITANYRQVATFTPQGRVGINTSTPTEVLDVNGKVNLKGLKIYGSAGVRGQVYTTGGPDLAPEWKSVAYDNNTRFAISLSGNHPTAPLTYTTLYNINTSNIQVNASSVTVNKSGLYHLDAFLYGQASYTNYTYPFPPTLSISLSSGGDAFSGRSSDFMIETPQNSGSSSRIFTAQVKFAYEVYIEAGETLTLGGAFGAIFPESMTYRGNLTGHLIIE